MKEKKEAIISIKGKDYLYFGGTSYYCLHKNEEMINAASSAIIENGLGRAVSRITYGNSTLLDTLERSLTDFFEAEDAVFLPSGYLSTLAGIKALKKLKHFNNILIDEKSHYSVFDGAKASGINIIPFNHCNYLDLEEKIKELKGKCLIVSDGVFPLKGTIAPLDKYSLLAKKYNCDIWFDDSHGVGILGQNMRGTVEYFGLEDEAYIYSGATLSKAFGSYGGFIFGEKEFVKAVREGDVVAGSNSMPFSVIAAGIKGLELLKNNPHWQSQLLENTQYLKLGISDLGIKIEENTFPIITIESIKNRSLSDIYEELLLKNIAVQLLKYSGSEEKVIRIVVFSKHSKEELDYLINTIKLVLSPKDIIKPN